MKKFNFSLEKVSNTKAIRLKNKSQELAKLLSSLENEELRLKDLNTELTGLHDEVLRRTIDGCSAKELRDYHRYLDKLTLEMQAQKKNIESIQEKIEELQASLMELSKEKKVLEKLREKRYLKHLQEQAREEQKILDEMSLVSRGIKNLL
jgi:flagellar FliJ protein